MTANRLLTPAETAAYLGITRKTLYRHWREWGLESISIGRELKFRMRDIEKFIERHRVKK